LELYLADKPYRRTCPNRPLHPSFLEIIQGQVKNGDVKGGVAKLYEALQVDGTSDVVLQVLQKEARRLAAPGLVEKGRQLARGGDVEGAVGTFRQALGLDPTLALDPRKEARQLAAAALVEKGRKLAREGDVDGAVGEFKKALDLDPNLALDPRKEARQLAAAALVEKGRQLARQGEIREAMAAFAEAQASDQNLEIPAAAWNSLCWYGSLVSVAIDVMAACERAVTLEPDHGGYHDSRGVARALTGSYSGAVEDFQRYLEWGPKNGRPQEEIRKRQDWIRTLQANQNPFNEELLEVLRDQ
jgi:tetratricopeptide (TPR) repeat protein